MKSLGEWLRIMHIIHSWSNWSEMIDGFRQQEMNSGVLVEFRVDLQMRECAVCHLIEKRVVGE